MGDQVLNKFALHLGVALIFVIALSACLQESKMSKPLPPGVPENAIHVKDDLYMVPIKPDNSGCMMYRAHSPKGPTVAAIFYRAADGAFVMDKSKSACD